MVKENSSNKIGFNQQKPPQQLMMNMQNTASLEESSSYPPHLNQVFNPTSPSAYYNGPN